MYWISCRTAFVHGGGIIIKDDNTSSIARKFNKMDMVDDWGRGGSGRGRNESKKPRYVCRKKKGPYISRALKLRDVMGVSYLVTEIAIV